MIPTRTFATIPRSGPTGLIHLSSTSGRLMSKTGASLNSGWWSRHKPFLKIYGTVP